MRRLALTGCAFAALFASTFASEARADDCLVDRKGLGLGFVVSSRGCEHTVNLDVFLSGVTSNWRDFGPRGTLELNYVHRVESLRSLDVGPMLALHVTDVFASKSSLAAMDLSTGVRGRYWLGEENPWMFFDAATGPIFTFPVHGQAPRAGAFLELGTNFAHGELGGFFDVEPTYSLVDHTLGWRYGIGAKTTLVGFAVVLIIYGCAQARCS